MTKPNKHYAKDIYKCNEPGCGHSIDLHNASGCRVEKLDGSGKCKCKRSRPEWDKRSTTKSRQNEYTY